MSFVVPSYSIHRRVCGLNSLLSSRGKTQFLKSGQHSLIFVLFLMVVAVSAGDQQALRDTVSSLCSQNQDGEFASCCASFGNGATLTLGSSEATSCFFAGFSASGGSLTSLFVDCFFGLVDCVS